MAFKHESSRPPTTWILVTDRSRARLFAGTWPEFDGFHEIQDFVHPEGGVHQREVESDGPGRFDGPDGAHHAGESETDFKHHTATEFARELVSELQRGKDTNAYGRLIIIAPPLFLGVLRAQLPAPLSKLVVADWDKDLTHQDGKAILDELRGFAVASAGGSTS